MKNLFRLLATSVGKFLKENGPLQAASLAFYSVMSLVPIVSLIFVIARRMGIEEWVNAFLTREFSDYEEVLALILNFTESVLKNIRGGILAAGGMFFLLLSAFQLWSTFEKVMNQIWHVDKKRPFYFRLGHFLLLICVAPIVFFVVGSLEVMTASGLKKSIAEFLPIKGMIHPFTVKVFSALLIFFVLGMVYRLTPACRVGFASAWKGSLLASVIFILIQWAYIHFQVVTARYGALYGSFAAFPLFLLWLQLSWSVILLGANFSYNIQKKKLS